MDKVLLEVRDISKSFGGVQAVDRVSFSIQHGDVFAIVGDNGAGKSTLIKMISGAYKRDHGDVLWEGEPVQIHSPEDARRLGIETMYQDLALVGDVDAAGNIFLGREPMTRLLGIIPVLDRKAMRRVSRSLLERIRIQLPDLDRPVRQLSGGQRQATAIARFLLNDHARCIIMDEPTAALGVQEARKVTDLIRKLKDEDITVVVISHNLEHVFSVSDKIMVLRGGRLAGIRDTHTSTKQEIVSLIMGAEVSA